MKIDILFFLVQLNSFSYRDLYERRLLAPRVNENETVTCLQHVPPSPNTFTPLKKSFILFEVFFLSWSDKECTPNLTTCPSPCNILWERLDTHRSLSVSVRVFCCRRWTMTTVTATPMMSPMATTPPRIPITPPGGPCAIGFSADKRRNNSVRVCALWVIDTAWMNFKKRKINYSLQNNTNDK